MLRRAETPADYFATLDVDEVFSGAEGLLLGLFGMKC